MLCGYLCAVLHHCIIFVVEVKYCCSVQDSYIDPFLPVTEDFACPFCLVKCGSYKVKFEDNLHLVYLFKCCLLLLRPGICVIYYIWGKFFLLFHTSHLLFIQMLLIAGLFLGTVITLSTLSYLFLWE